jgi:hypothetical protein
MCIPPPINLFFSVSFFWIFFIYILPSASLCRVLLALGKAFAECPTKGDACMQASGIFVAFHDWR